MVFGAAYTQNPPSGMANPRSGIRVYTNVVHLWDEYGSTEGGGSGTSMMLGVGAGPWVGEGYHLDTKSQVRSAATSIYDIAPVIHHNLGEGFIID
jgi:hypothetical protein